MHVRAVLRVHMPLHQKSLKLFLPQIIQLKSVALQTTQGWKKRAFQRQLETATLHIPKRTSQKLQLRVTYSIVFHSKKNYLFRAIFCRIDPHETYFMYGWYPSLHPFADPLSGKLLKGHAFPYLLHIDVPASQMAISAGKRIRRTQLPNRRVRYTYRPAVIKEAAIFFIVGSFKRTVVRPHPHVRVDFYIRPSDGTRNIQKLAQLAVKTEQFYRRVWGSPTVRTLRPIRWQFITFGGSGARGYPFTLLLDQQQGYFKRSLLGKVDSLFTRRQVLLHEMAHTWWGNTLTGVGKGSIWLNEGLANYASIRALGALYGKKAEYRAIRRHIRYFLRSSGRGGLLDGGGLAQMAQRTAYTKGALVFFELERLIGRATLDRGLHMYIRRFRGRFAHVKDLQQALEDASKRSLKVFFRDWIYGHKLPLIRFAGWKTIASKPTQHTLALLLSNRGGIASKAHIRAYFSKGPARDMWIDVSVGVHASYRRVFRKKPIRIQLDPEGIMLHGFRSKALFKRANRLRRQRKWKQAKVLFEKLLQQEPEHGHAHYSLGLLLSQQKKWKHAIAHFIKAIRLKTSRTTPSWLSVWCRFRIAVLYHKMGQTQKALKYLKALLKQPRDPYGLKIRVRTYLQSFKQP